MRSVLGALEASNRSNLHIVGFTGFSRTIDEADVKSGVASDI